MKNHPNRPPLRVAVKYGLLQLPGQMLFVLLLLLVRQWVDIPVYVMLAMIGLSVGKDILLFPFLWRYYDPNLFPDRFQMVGRRGQVLTRLNPHGFVQIRGERWQAEVAADKAPVDAGEIVCVEAINGLRLTVNKCTKGTPD